MTKLSELLKAWQKTPSEALRALVLALDDAAPLAELRGLETLKTAEVIERLSAFRTKAKDPRVTRALEQLVTEARWSSDASKPMWRAVFELVSRTNDPRLKQLKPAFAVRASMKDWLTNQYAKAVEELPDAFAPADETKWKAALAAVPRKRAAPDAQDEAALFDAVYAAPEDDAPRLVLADLLTQKGDPRGELISLQCGARDEKRERELIKTHGKKWLAHFGPSLGAEVEWRRGFPAVGLAKFKARSLVEKYGVLPAWATFEELRWHDSGSSEEPRWTRFVGPHFQALRRADGPHLPSLVASPRPFPRLEALSAWFPDAAALAGFATSKNFPRLHTLHLLGNPALPWVQPLTSFGTVKVVTLGDRRDVDTWLELFARFPHVEEVGFPTGVRFRRGKRGAFSHLILETAAGDRSNRYWRLADSIPPGVVETLEVVGDGALPPDEEKALRAKVGTQKVAAPKRTEGELPPLTGQAPLEWLDGQHVAVAQPGQVLVVDVSKGKPRLVRSLPAPRIVQSIAVLDAGKTVLTANQTLLQAIDAVSGEERFSLQHAYDGSPALSFSPDRTRVSRQSGVYDLKTRAAIPPPRGAKGDRRAPDDSCWLRQEGIQPYQLRLPGVRAGIPLEDGERVSGVLFVADGVVGRHPKRGLVKWSLADGRIVASVSSSEPVRIGARPSNDQRFVATNDGEKGVLVATLPALELVGHAKAPAAITSLAVSDDGKRVAVCAGQTLSVLTVEG